MKWDKINLKVILKMLREIEKDSMSLGASQSIIYSDDEEELKITYRKLK